MWKLEYAELILGTMQEGCLYLSCSTVLRNLTDSYSHGPITWVEMGRPLKSGFLAAYPKGKLMWVVRWGKVCKVQVAYVWSGDVWIMRHKILKGNYMFRRCCFLCTFWEYVLYKGTLNIFVFGLWHATRTQFIIWPHWTVWKFEVLGMMGISAVPVLSATIVILWIGGGLNFTTFRNFGHKLSPDSGCKFGAVRVES